MDGEPHHNSEMKQFVDHDYVYDGLRSFINVRSAVSLLKKTQDVQANSNLRLHKIASNNKEVMEAFSPQELFTDQ